MKMTIHMTWLLVAAISVETFWTEEHDDRLYRRRSDPATNTVAIFDAYDSNIPFRRPLELTGTVVDHACPGFILRDKSGNAILKWGKSRELKPGDVVRVKGLVHHFGTNDNVPEARQLTVIGHTPPPERILTCTREICQGNCNFRRVIFEGIVSEATRDEVDEQWNWLVIDDNGHRTAICYQDPLAHQEELDRLIDAKVRVSGVALHNHAGSRRYLDNHVEIDSLDSITILEPPPAPFDESKIPVFHMSVDRDMRSFGHRRRVSGLVVATWEERNLFIETGEHERIHVQLNREMSTPALGSRVTATGFIQRNAFYPWLRNAMIRQDGAAVALPDEPIAQPSDMAIRKCNDPQIFFPHLNGRLIRINGLSIGTFTDARHHAKLCLSNGADIVPVELGDLTPPPSGAQIEVTGICVMSVDSSRGENGFGRIVGFSVVPRRQSDIVMLKGPPWMTPAKFGAIVALFVLFTAGLILWNHLKAKRATATALLRLNERTRLAIELHDSLAQSLTGVSLQLDAAEMAEADNPSAAAAHLASARKALKSCREGLRYCIGDLRRRSFEDADMADAVSETVRPHIGQTRLHVRFNVPRSRLSDSSAHALLCIVRELAVNSVRHGKASNIRIAGELKDAALRVSVRDDGCGFDASRTQGPENGHFGLLGIRERIEGFKGTMKIESAPGKGTKTTIILNLHETNLNSHRR